MNKSKHKRWQLLSIKPRELFDILKDPNAEIWLSTVELPSLNMPELAIDIPVKYESCYFEAGGDSRVLATYSTKEEAVIEHEKYRVKLGLGVAEEGVV